MIRVEGHFGELVQGRLGASGPVVLVSLPCAALAVTARLLPQAGLSIHGSGQRIISPARARALLQDLGIRMTGRIVLRADMPAGGGAGASTAALVAIARLAGVSDSVSIARACLRTEGATDPLMFPDAGRRVWASRLGKTVSNLPEIEPFDVIGGFIGAPVATDARDARFPDVEDLIKSWTTGRLDQVAELATESARRTIALRGPRHDQSEALAKRLGARGWMIAHTGSARGYMFPKGQTPPNAKSILRDAGYKSVVRFRGGA
ncbi:propanediol utilization protein [Albirhodobacter sp. R86504]|uniref:propanediol utilization protein n=1 Tax=Albirhodobacter sp. R86504 TaxID=3093848 RepID=UPI0036701F95